MGLNSATTTNSYLNSDSLESLETTLKAGQISVVDAISSLVSIAKTKLDLNLNEAQIKARINKVPEQMPLHLI